MSHHFDTATAKEDPRLNLYDFYLFDGAPGNSVMAMTVNPEAGGSAPSMFGEEALYSFRFDLDGDAREDVTFRVQFGKAGHAGDHEHKHVQAYKVSRATGQATGHGGDGEIVLTGQIGQVVKTDAGLMTYAGLAPDLFAGDAVALGAFRKALYNEDRSLLIGMLRRSC